MLMLSNVKIGIAALIVIAAVGVPLVLKQAGKEPAVANSMENVVAAKKEPCPGTNGSQLCDPNVAVPSPSKASALPKFVDLGTTTCAPCKAMLRVMDELRTQYPGKLDIQFVNVKEQWEKMDAYGVSAIPTQIFYSPDSRELFRHTGYFSTKEVVAKWKELGFDLGGGAAGPGGR